MGLKESQEDILGIPMKKDQYLLERFNLILILDNCTELNLFAHECNLITSTTTTVYVGSHLNTHGNTDTSHTCESCKHENCMCSVCPAARWGALKKLRLVYLFGFLFVAVGVRKVRLPPNPFSALCTDFLYLLTVRFNRRAHLCPSQVEQQQSDQRAGERR